MVLVVIFHCKVTYLQTNSKSEEAMRNKGQGQTATVRPAVPYSRAGNRAHRPRRRRINFGLHIFVCMLFVVHLMTLSVAEIIQHRMMIDENELERIWKEAFAA
jgi:hypothetical protein